MKKRFSYLQQPPGFYKRVFLLALPVVLQNLITTSLGFMDTFMVGLLGSEEMSAVTVANTPIFIMQLLLFGLQSGSGVLISQYWGKNDRASISRVLGIGLYAALGIASVFALLTLFAPARILALITDNPRLIELAAPYLRIVGISYLFDALASIYVGMQRSTENPLFGMAVFMTSTAVNTLGNYILIFGKLGAPALGIVGAATATLTARALELVICGVYLLRDKRLPPVLRCVLCPGRAMLRAFIKYSTPVLANETLWGLGTSMFTVIMGHMRISTDIIAAYTVAGAIDRIIVAGVFGLAAAAGVIIGKEVGSGNRTGVQDIGRALCFVALCLGVMIGGMEQLLYWAALRPALLPLFHLSPLAARLCSTLMCCYSAMAPVMAFATVVIVGVLRAGGDVRASLLIDLIPLWCVTIPLSALTALVLDAPVVVVCMAMTSEAAFKLAPGLLRLHSGRWIHDVTTTRE